MRTNSQTQQSNSETDFSPIVIWDYYIGPFALFEDELQKEGYSQEKPHPIRKRYWTLLPARVYDPFEARPLIQQYLRTVERELAEAISKQSLAYWLHLYRRLFPGGIGRNREPSTTGQVRGLLEAAIQKYSAKEPCNRVGTTSNIPIDKILSGILMNDIFVWERQVVLKGKRQLVLTNFTHHQLREFYEIERLAYEIWYGSAALRIVGKGAPIIIDTSNEYVFYDTRSDDLDFLVSNFDKRLGGWDYWLLSSTGLVTDLREITADEAGIVYLPTYNLTKLPFVLFEEVLKRLRLNVPKIQENYLTNFIWVPFAIRQFRELHLPFKDAFSERFKVNYDAVLLVIASLLERVRYIWSENNSVNYIRYWQRAYEGPLKRKYVIDEIFAFANLGCSRLGIERSSISDEEINKAIKFWELRDETKSKIDLNYSGPHSLFLPFGKNRIFIDYAWISRRLYSLMTGVVIQDQNFKGDIFEKFIRRNTSILPIGGCKLAKGEKKQIDASFVINKRLIIIECKAAGQSIGFFRGDPEAIRHRVNLCENALKQVDEKANWLAENPIGTNYNISSCDEILPIVVTPFVEYTHSRNRKYWLTDDLPRVMTPKELDKAFNDEVFSAVNNNVVKINKS